MKKSIKSLWLVLAVMLLAGCSGYRQYGGTGGGFVNKQIDYNVYQVFYLGNFFTSQERQADLALLRAAELTIEQDKKYFITVLGYGAGEGSFRYNGQSYQLAQPLDRDPRNFFFITLNQKPSGVSKKYVFSADEICDSIGQEYRVICGSTKVESKTHVR